MHFFYNLGIRLYLLAIWIAALFSPKAKQWLAGRRHWRQRLAAQLAAARPQGTPLVWFHCASLGEFEQGRPLIERLKAQTADIRVLLTFYSPSGYEIRKDYPLADIVAYLPADTPRQARHFVEITQPTLTVFVKYEFWRHHLQALQRAGIPIVLISAVFRPGQIFFRWYGGLFRRLLPLFDHIFVQNEESEALLIEKTGLENVSRAGDTRIDRVVKIASEDRSFPLVKAFAAGASVLVAGSTWPPDEAQLAALAREALPPDWKIILAPHQIRESHLRNIEAAFSLPSVRYSQANQLSVGQARLLLIDNVGMLSALYRYGRLAYIGGGYGAGIHNTLEPVTFGLPVIFGPRYDKFEEARQLIQKGGAFSIETQTDLIRTFRALLDAEHHARAAHAARAYIDENRGGTERIFQVLRRDYPELGLR